MTMCALLKKNNTLSTYFGEGKYKERSAEVCRSDKGFFVRFYRHDHCVEERHLYDHAEVYAENAAENWVIGVIQ